MLCSLVSLALSGSYEGVFAVGCLVGNAFETLLGVAAGSSRQNVFLGSRS